MPAKFIIEKEKSYHTSIWEGCLSNKELVEAYASFFQQNPDMNKFNELCDLSKADVSLLTIDGLREVSEMASDYFIKNNISHAKCATYIPNEINHSITDLYECLSSDSPETTQVFTERQDAIDWLEE